MTMLDPRLCEELERLIAKTPADRIQRLLSDIRDVGAPPKPTHEAPKRTQ